MWYYVAVNETGEWIKQNRHRKGWSVDDLSTRLREMGYEASPGTLRRWEGPKGGRPKERTLAAMETLFGTRAPDADAVAVDALERIAAVLEEMGGVEKLREDVVSIRRELMRLAVDVEGLREQVGHDTPVRRRHD